MSELTLLQEDVLKNEENRGDICICVKNVVILQAEWVGAYAPPRERTEYIERCRIIYNERQDMITQRLRRI